MDLLNHSFNARSAPSIRAVSSRHARLLRFRRQPAQSRPSNLYRHLSLSLRSGRSRILIFWNFPDTNINAGWWAAASFIIALLMQSALVVFAWVFPENSRLPKTRTAVLFAPSLILIPAAVSGLLWRKVGFEGTDSLLILRRWLTFSSFTFILYSDTVRSFYSPNTANIAARSKVSKSARFFGQSASPAF